MPFISKDWRSPGEEWVKTQEGWEKKKVLECTSQRYPAISNYNNTDETQHKTWLLTVTVNIVGKPVRAQTITYNGQTIRWSQDWWRPQESEEGDKNTGDDTQRVPPHCHITIKCTREIAGFNGLSEAVRRLDFSSAVRDVRRFNYICALLNLLVGEQRLTHLPGAAQRLLLSMLEEVANQVATSKQNLNALRALLVALSALRESERRACWGRPLGSKALWGHHDHTIARIKHIADNICIQEPGPEVRPKLHDLPEECIREILLRISDHRDLDAASSAWNLMASLCGEQRVWRELTLHHFTAAQIAAAGRQRHDSDTCDTDDEEPPSKDVDWKTLFHKLRRHYGLREDAQYAETLSLCRHCKCLFWRSLGHPCIADQCPEYRERLKEAGGPLPPHPVPPAAFLKFFSL